MQKWEYMFVVPEHERDYLRPRYVNGQELPNWKKGQTIYEYMNQLGEQGWELVSAPYTATTNTGTVPRLIFKRPKT